MNPIDNNSMVAEIQRFMQQTFSNCSIASQYYPDQVCWKFYISFVSHTKQYHINPPQGCCLMNIQAMGETVSFTIILFVEDFKKYHAAKLLN